MAVDEFAVVLRDPDRGLDLLVREIEEVDGVSVEQVRTVEHFPDPRLDALESAARVVRGGVASTTLQRTLVEQIRAEFLADWSALLLDVDGVLASSGEPTPDPCGARSARQRAPRRRRWSPTAPPGPTTSRWRRSPSHEAALLVGRDGHPFRRRERAQLLALAGIADRTWTMLTDAGVTSEPWRSVAVVVFTRDLRVTDHPALADGRGRRRSGRPAVRASTTRSSSASFNRPNRTGFLLESLDDLDARAGSARRARS